MSLNKFGERAEPVPQAGQSKRLDPMHRHVSKAHESLWVEGLRGPIVDEIDVDPIAIDNNDTVLPG